MKKVNAVYTIIILVTMCVNTLITIATVRNINRETQVHWLLPKGAKCAVKMMWFRDAAGKKYPANQMVCHFDAALAQPIRIEPNMNKP